jgi:hypothetical protein
LAIYVTQEVGPVDWSKFKAALDWSRAFPANGRLSSHVYRSDADPTQIMIVERWLSPEQMKAYQDQINEEFNRRAGTTGLAWKDISWTLVEQT